MRIVATVDLDCEPFVVAEGVEGRGAVIRKANERVETVIPQQHEKV